MMGISDWQVATMQMTEPAVHIKEPFKQTFSLTSMPGLKMKGQLHNCTYFVKLGLH